MYPRSNEVLYVNGALLTGRCSGLVGLAAGVHYVCTPQGGSQHTLSECLALLPLVIPRENLFCLNTMGKWPGDVRLCGVCFDNLQDSLVRDAIEFHRNFVPLCHPPKNISSPSILIAAG
jgi:hypothetical protein